MQTYFAKIKKSEINSEKIKNRFSKSIISDFLLSFWLAMRLYSKNKHKGQLRKLAKLQHDLAKQAKPNLDNQVPVSGQKLY